MRRINVLAAAAALLIPGPAAAATGPSLWNQAGCGSCHTLSAAGATGTAGPNLDSLRPSAGAVAYQVANGGGGMPAFAGGLTPADIQTLAAWVAGAAGGAAPTAVGQPTVPSMPVAAVKKLQRALRRLGYFHAPVTGFYGPITTTAVKRFQRAHGLTVDGIWGPQSQAALGRA